MYRTQHVQDEIKEDFLPRPDKYKDILNNKLMPTTNESIVVIPCLTKTYGFKTNQYKQNMKYLQGIISAQQFNGFVRKANSIIQKELINKSTQQNEPFFKFTSILLKISIVLSALALLLMAIITYSTFESRVSDIILYVSVVLLGSSSLVAAFCPIYLYKAQYTSQNYQEIISQQLKALEAQQNKANLADGKKQFIWKVQKNFYWIELHIIRSFTPKDQSIESNEERFS